jgi:hypothetical protein
MNDEPIKDNQQPEYDARDPEVPIVLHKVSAGLSTADAHNKHDRAERYIHIALQGIRTALVYIWHDALWNRGFWTFAATVVMAVAAALYTHYARKQLKAINDQFPELHTSAEAAKKSADTAARQLELAERPWVSAGIAIAGPFDFTVNGANIHLKLHLQNTGPSPALNTVIEGRPVDSAFTGGPDTLQMRDEACNAANGMIQKFPTSGIALFPNNPFEQTLTWTFTASELAKNHGAGSRVPGVIVWPAIVICIGYQPPFDPTKIYHTSYILDLFKTDPITRLPNVNFTINQNVPANLLFLRIDSRGGLKAD